ncbi:MAG: helix-turn-helix domain-containing protein [Caldilineaceae bacterium]
MVKSTTTIDDIFRLALPPATHLLAGDEYLSRTVTWACSLRPSPPAFPKLDGNELALVDMEDLRRLDPQMRLDRVVFSLQGARVAAIAVAGSIDGAAINAARATGLVLFQLPEASSLIYVERTVIRLIVDRAGYIAQRATELQRELNQVALVGGGIEQIVQSVQQFAQQPVILVREDGTVLAQAGLQELGEAQSEAVLASLPSARELRSRAAYQIAQPAAGPVLNGSARNATLAPLTDVVGSDFTQVVVAAVVASEGIRGYCLLLRPATAAPDLTAVEEIAASQCAAAAALDWAMQNAVDVAADRMRAAFLDELLAAEVADEQAWVQRGGSLGFDLNRPHVAWLVEARGIPDWPAPLLRFLREHNLRAPLSRRDEGLLVFWPTDDAKSARNLKSIAEEFVARQQRAYPRARVRVGIGRPAQGPSHWLQSQHQARESWRLGKEWKGAAVTYFGDLGLYQLLTALGTNPEAARFYRKTLGKLMAYDNEKHAELVATLEGFFACHGNLSQTAARMHIHRNTLTYRLEQIANITQLDLDDPDARFSLQLALKLRPILR